MFSACNEQGEIICAESAPKEPQYRCWACGQRVLLKNGSIKVPHFAHERNELCNGWNYRPMTQWHHNMQQYFSATEVPMENTNTGERHIADAVVRNGKDCIVFEFQHSSISPVEVRGRTDFYLSMGYKVVWVFDFTDKFKKTIDPWGPQEDGIYCWKNPIKSLQYLPLYHLHDRVRILFYWKEYDSSGNCRELLNPVCWTPVKEKYHDPIRDYSPDFRVFAISKQIVLSMDKQWPIREIFTPFSSDFSLYERAAEYYLETLNRGNLYPNSNVRFQYYHFHHKKMLIRILSPDRKYFQKLLDIVEESVGDDEIIIIDADGKTHQNDYCSAEIISNKIRFDFDIYETSITEALSVYAPIDDDLKWL